MKRRGEIQQAILLEHLAQTIWSFLDDGDTGFVCKIKNGLITGKNDGEKPIGLWELKGVDGIIKEQKIFI